MTAAISAPFEDVVIDISAGNIKIQRTKYLQTGTFPVIDQGQDFIGGYSNSTSDIVQGHGPWILFGDHTRALKFVDFPFCMGADGVKILRPRSEKQLDPKYLYHFLAAHPIPSVGYSRHFKFLKRLFVPIPPLVDQQRIAAVLDQADALRRKRKHALNLLDSLTNSLFLEIFGNLLAVGTYRRGLISDWVADFETGKNMAPDADAAATDGFRILKVSAVTSGRFVPSESKPLPAGYTPPEAHLVREGDLLFSRANTESLIGAVAHVDRAMDRLVLPDKIWRFRWRAENEPHPLFIYSLFSADAFRHEVSKRATGTSGSMKNISKEKVLSIQVGQPSRAEQDNFVRACLT